MEDPVSKDIIKNKKKNKIGHTPPSKHRIRRRPRRRSSHKPPLGTAARAEGSDKSQNNMARNSLIFGVLSYIIPVVTLLYLMKRPTEHYGETEAWFGLAILVISILLGILLAIISIVVGSLGLKHLRMATDAERLTQEYIKKSKAMATAGKVLGTLFLLAMVAGAIFLFSSLLNFLNSVNFFGEWLS